MPDARTDGWRLEELLEHGDWLRQLAREVVGDASVAEDVVQETWLRAIERPPERRASPRGWLATVAHNLARRARRDHGRRRRREERAAAHEALPSTVEVLADIQVRERLVRALRELDEPYRSTLWWRYVDGRSAVEIGRAQGLTASAVRTRIQRGLDRLRAQLGLPKPPPRRSALGAVALLLRPFSTGGLLMGAPSKVATAAIGVALVLVTVLWWQGGSPSIERQAPPGGSSRVAATTRSEREKPDARSDGVVRDRVPTELDEEPAPRPRLRGTVIDAAGLPVAGVPIRWRATNGEVAGESVESDAAGRFALPLPKDDAAGVAVAGAPWLTLRGWPNRGGSEATIVVAPAVTLAGRIEDERGAPVEGVELRATAVELPRLTGSFEDHTGFPSVATTSDADGRFELAGVPGTLDARLKIEHPGFERWSAPAPTRDERHMRITLERGFDDHFVGEVVDARGRPVAGALVDFAQDPQETDEHGRFAVAWPADPRRPTQLVVVAKGHRPFVVEEFGRDIWQSTGAPRPYRVVLDEEPLSIEGHVVHADGSPAVGYRVAFRRPTMLYARYARLCAEQVSAGRDDCRPIDAYPVRDDGSFTVGGLLPRDYELVAWDPESLVAIAADKVAAGSRGVRISVPADPVRGELRGRVVSYRGAPLAGVEVGLTLQILPGYRGVARSERQVVTDDEGRFAFADVPRRGEARIGLTGDPVIPRFHRVEEFADRESVELRVPARCHVRFLGGSPQFDAEYVLFHDAEGEYVPLWNFTEDGMDPRHGWPLGEGPSAEFAVSELACQLVYYRAGEEVGRRPVTLVPGEVNHVAP